MGGVVSTTRKTVLQLALLAEGSVTVNTMARSPAPTTVPGAGIWITFRDPDGAQLSKLTTWASKSGTSTWHVGPDEIVITPGQETTGGVVSLTNTTTFVCDEASQGSVTFRVMV